ncbi:hypothetical protein TNCV_1968571 [Trichonephila clavipes]|nr:hypothetical protein TNCV_1968571 [Trichonephila clavipes]
MVVHIITPTFRGHMMISNARRSCAYSLVSTHGHVNHKDSSRTGTRLKRRDMPFFTPESSLVNGCTTVTPRLYLAVLREAGIKFTRQIVHADSDIVAFSARILVL